MKLLKLLEVVTLIFFDVIPAQYITTITPPGCRKLRTGADWPSILAWGVALPGVTATNGTDKHGPTDDYRLQAKSVEDV